MNICYNKIVMQENENERDPTLVVNIENIWIRREQNREENEE